MITPVRIPRREERGFALLFILLVAAGIAISMYMELPRIAFETQRNREELLMQRGHEYQRAVGLYLKKFQRYPAKIEDLESTNNLRFLRRRYVDPMTGKDDWRIIHAGPGGMLIDSLVKRKAAPGMAGPSPGMGPGMNSNNGNAMAPGGSMNVDPGFGSSNSTDPNQPQEVNAAVQRRASDRSLAGNAAGAPGGASSGDPNAPPMPPSGQFTSQFPGQPGQQPIPGQPGQQPAPGQPGWQQPGQPGTAGFAQQPQGVIGEQPQTPGTGQPGDNSAPRPGMPGMPGMPLGMAGVRPGFPPQPLNPMQQQPSAFNQQPQVQPGGVVPGSSGIGTGLNSNNAGIQAVNNALSGQSPGLSGGNNSAFKNGPTGGGIAGVASKFKGPSIKVHDEQQRYEKWEFVYDPKQDLALTKNLPAAQAVTNPGNTDTSKPSDPRQP
jgi:type II secretory pathway pseudopilin PulG